MAQSFNAIIKDRCTKITSDMDVINKYIHDTGMMIVKHAAPEALGGHGDCDTALWLAKAMPASMRRTMLLAWFEKYTPIRVKLGDSEKVGFDPRYKKLSPEDKVGAWDIEGASNEPFYVIAEKTPEEKPMDFAALMKLVEGLTKKIDKAIEDGKVPDEDLPLAKALSIKIGGVRVGNLHGDNTNTSSKGEESAA